MLRYARFFVVLAALAVSHVADNANAQSNVKDLANQAYGEMRTLYAFRRLEKSLNEIDHLLTYGIVSSAGGWGVIELVETTDSTNSSVISAKTTQLRGYAEQANKEIQSGKFSTEGQMTSAALVFDGIAGILTAAENIAIALDADDLETARNIYRNECQTLYEESLLTAQSSIASLEKALSASLFKLRLAK